MDIREVRKSRLYLLSSHIEEFASELSLSPADFDWALRAYSTYSSALNVQNSEITLKNNLSRKSLESDVALFERYVVMKGLLLNKIENLKDIQRLYGIEEAVPYNRLEKYKKIQRFIEANDSLIAELSNYVLPQLMIDNLKKLYSDAYQNYQLSEQQRIKTIEYTNTLNKLHDNDSLNLRSFYNWLVAFWGKRDLKLLNLGFVPIKTIKLTSLVNDFQIEFNRKEKILTWPEIKGIEHYQVAIKDNESSKNWLELHNSLVNSCKLSGFSGEIHLKLRVKFTKGYSNWSKNLILKVDSNQD